MLRQVSIVHAIGAVPLIVTFALSGCRGGEVITRDACRNSKCIHDPQPHSVCLDDCRDDEDCPVGAICTIDSDGRSGCSVPAEPVSPRDQLMQGFSVPELEANVIYLEQTLEGDPLGSPVLDWSAPVNSALVSCALFACPPVIDIVQNDVDSLGHLEIINFDRCVLAATTSPESAGSFDPRNPDFAHDPEEPRYPSTMDCTASSSGEVRIVTGLWVGCWSYDGWGLNAASKLYEIGPKDVLDPDNIFADGPDFSCQDGDTGRNCKLLPTEPDVVSTDTGSSDNSESGGSDSGSSDSGSSDSDTGGAISESGTGQLRYGTCDGSECRPRCVNDADCFYTDSPTCSKEDDANPLGLCRPLT